MQHDLENTIALLTRTPAVLDALLRGLPDIWIRGNEGGDSWSTHDVVSHLIHAERADWMPRIRTILQFGDTQAFEPFDRQGNIQESRELPLSLLLDQFAELRAANLSSLRELHLQRELRQRGRHPALGLVTLSELLATWAAHDLTHLHQISRVLAHHYSDAVGPFRAFLGVMHCNGHSAP